MKNNPSFLQMNRRNFMAAAGATVAAPALFYPSNAQGKPAKNVPNILFIHVDQLSMLDSISAFGAEYVKTPGIDRIIKNGTAFMNSYATDPVCCPARTSWWSGTYSSENGVVVNNTACHEDVPDLSRLLQKAGYNTYYDGKWHVPGKQVRKLFHVLHEGSWWGELTDREVTRSCLAFLRNYNDEKPFFLSIGYLNPHDICITPTLDYNRCKEEGGQKVPRYLEQGILSNDALPPLPCAHEYDKREPSIQIATHRGNIDKPKFHQWSKELWRVHRYNYHRFIEMVDQEIELVLDELDRSPWRDNTLIIFTSDHGEGMGRHWGVGKSTFYEETVKVPFVIATLGDVLEIKKNTRDTKHLISGIDFGRTVCDYAGADGSKMPHGRSLRPLAEGKEVSDWRSFVYAESSVYMHMITDGRYKYIRGYEEDGPAGGLPPSHKTHSTGVEQLFDVKEDPDEQKNLAYNKEYQDMLKKLRSVMNRKEDERMPIRKVTHSTGLDWMKKYTDVIRQKQYPRSHPVT